MYLAWTGLFSVCFIMVFKSEFASKICNEKKKKEKKKEKPLNHKGNFILS